MLKSAKNLSRFLARCAGLEFRRLQKPKLGIDPFNDLQYFLSGITEPTVYDVGANIGQSVDRFINIFPHSRIHSFEPSPTTFEQLKVHCQRHSNVSAWNLGIGSSDGALEFIENIHSDMSSFLLPSKLAWGEVTNKVNTEVTTIDTFSKGRNIEYIHILKSDTQGFDFEVFKGAEEMMSENRIGLIYFEFIFADMYQNLPSFDQVFRYLTDNGFLLVSFYGFHFQNDLASWTDAIFISSSFYKKRLEMDLESSKLI
ncbi:FkbM family methyltransferase [Cyanobium sp. BA20m-14]|uniref:FkbM family methyltransferase n=1 Tax=Cyanobium sp. BA20m-14 TaxID=2823703 RepID=UPI0020CBE1A3|nr:FkbM family methyltransferase [Cyanobium sp. BA20m-14]MCP9913973.1 FkbM family methyltransferase [Cyanobium sp. BA20m-14]